MSDEMTIGGIALAVAGVIGGAIRWGVGRLTKSWDSNGDDTRKALDRNTDAMLDNTKGYATLSAKIDNVALVVQYRSGLTPPVGTPVNVSDPPTQPISTVEVTAQVGVAAAPKTRTATPAKGTQVPGGGYHYARASSRGEGE